MYNLSCEELASQSQYVIYEGKLSENRSGTVTREEVINLNCKILDLTIKINIQNYKLTHDQYSE